MHPIVNVEQAELWNGEMGRSWAKDYERLERMGRGNTEMLLAAAEIGADHWVLDIGCGAGRTTSEAGHRAPHGRVVGIDLSAPMLERARFEAEEQGQPHVSFIQGDAQVHPFEDGEFDLAISRAGVMFFADPVAAFSNIRRALRPGGRLVFVCPQGRMGQLGEVLTALAQQLSLDAPLPFEHAPNAPGPMSLADPDRIRAVLTGAGFAQITPTASERASSWGKDVEDAAAYLVGWSPVRHLLREADPETASRAQSVLATILQRYQEPDGVQLSVPGWLVTARRPLD